MVNTTEKMEISELLNKSSYALDERKIELLGDCFAKDAVMSLRISGEDLIGPFDGHEEIMKLMKDSMDTQTDQRRHVISNLFFEKEDEEVVTVVSYLTLFATENKEINLLTTGIYRDEVVKVDGEWKINNRHLDLELPY